MMIWRIFLVVIGIILIIYGGNEYAQFSWEVVKTGEEYNFMDEKWSTVIAYSFGTMVLGMILILVGVLAFRKNNTENQT